jgi:hypothetical protein
MVDADALAMHLLTRSQGGNTGEHITLRWKMTAIR